MPDSTARPTAITMAPAPKVSAGQAASKKRNQEALKQASEALEASSLAKMSQKHNTREAEAEPAEEPVPKKGKFAPPASWLGNHEQNVDAEQNGESEQNADIFAPPRILFPANAAGTGNASPAETNQPALAGAAESKPQEACNK